jgi:hypothetical protein
MQELGKLLVIAGLLLTAVGLLLWKTGGLAGLGRLPGDISIQRPGVSFYFPITTCILVSIILTLIMRLFRR